MKTAKAIIKEFCYSNNNTYYYGNITQKRVIEDIFEYQRIDENMFPKVDVSVKIFHNSMVYELDIDRFILNFLEDSENEYSYIFSNHDHEIIEVSIIFDDTRTKIVSCVANVYESKEDFYNGLDMCSIYDERIKAFVKQPQEENANEKQAGQKPKFKVGDWVVSDNNNVAYIESISETKYNLQCKDGYHEKMSIGYVDRCWHFWTIQDAKPGDVLAAHECLVLFKEIDGLNIRCYCTYHFMNTPSFYVDTLQNKDAFHPATKEQRDTLEKAMADAGYTFDFEKKGE